jgi:hypothetical protein
MVSVPASNEARMSVFDFEHIDDGRLRIAVPEYAVVFPMVDDEPWTTAWSFEVNINNDAWASDPWIPVKREVFEDVAQVSMNCFFHQVDEE